MLNRIVVITRKMGRWVKIPKFATRIGPGSPSSFYWIHPLDTVGPNSNPQRLQPSAEHFEENMYFFPPGTNTSIHVLRIHYITYK